MPNYFHIPTKTLHRSVSEAAGFEGDPDYLKNPDLSAVEKIPPKYWEVDGVTVRPIDP